MGLGRLGEENEKTKREKRIRSEVRKVEKREEKDDIVNKFKQKVEIVRRGPRWNKAESIEEWVKDLTGEDCNLEFVRESKAIAKIWCEVNETREILLGKKEERNSKIRRMNVSY